MSCVLQRRVLSGIVGMIKGSEEAFKRPEGFLDMDTYLKIYRRTHPTTIEQRVRIYSLFELYSSMKRERYQYDAADRCGSIILVFSVM